MRKDVENQQKNSLFSLSRRPKGPRKPKYYGVFALNPWKLGLDQVIDKAAMMATSFEPAPIVWQCTRRRQAYFQNVWQNR
jgi:hypothetical protein